MWTIPLSAWAVRGIREGGQFLGEGEFFSFNFGFFAFMTGENGACLDADKAD